MYVQALTSSIVMLTTVNHCGWHKGDIADIYCTWSYEQNTEYHNIIPTNQVAAFVGYNGS